MQSRYFRLIFLAFAVILTVSLCLVDGQAQSRKRRSRTKAKPAAPKPVITNPPIVPPGEEGSDVKIVSTAEEGSTSSDQSESTSETKPKKKTGDQEDVQQSINTLSDQVDKLSDKLSKMQESDRAMIDMERLTRAEQRAESLRSQLLDNETKMADLQLRLEQIEFSIKPENIERSTATYGSTRPEEARDALRRSLQNERTRLQNQVRILETSKARLEQAVNSADAEVDLLRRRLEAREQQQDNAQSDQAEKPANNRKKPE
jgi:chromosome segregation ATPase